MCDILTGPYVIIALSNPYHLVESTFNFRGIRNIFYLIAFLMTFLLTNNISPDEDAWLIWVEHYHLECMLAFFVKQILN